MNYIYLDIETIPCQDAGRCAELVANAKPPANYKKPESIEKWRKDNADSIISKTSFDGAYGHICQISALTDTGENFSYHTHETSQESECIEQLSYFLNLFMAKGVGCVLVGHNLNKFDIRFIWQRAIALGVALPSWFPKDPKPWGNDTFDTMTAWAGSGGTISLDNLAKALGIKGKQGIDGSMIAKMWAEGKHQEIEEYCMDDVRLVKAIHEQMRNAGL